MQNETTIEQILKISSELEELEKKLLTPRRTVCDIVRHMQLLKELNKLIA